MTYTQIAKKYGVSRQRIQQKICPPQCMKEFIVERDNFKCVLCGTVVGYSGHIHHKGYKESYNNPANLELLCTSCHVKIHKGPPQTRPCTFCGKQFTAHDMSTRIKRNVSGRFFCSKFCQGKWLGINCGSRYGRPKGSKNKRPFLKSPNFILTL